jgi:4-hydroxy-tetrahydrodipicolinate reductase
MGQMVLSLLREPGHLTLGGLLVRPGSPLLGKRPWPEAPAYTTVDAWEGEAQVLVDFSRAAALEPAVQLCHRHRLALVSGTTALGPGELELLELLGVEVPVLWAPNFSPGLAALRQGLRAVAAHLPDGYEAEILEAHHAGKADLPSGTAIALAEELARARGVKLQVRCPRGGPRAPAEIGVHGMRLADLAGLHEVWLAGAGETIVLRHEVRSRQVFARGALDAAQRILSFPPGRLELEEVLRGPPSAGGGGKKSR